MVSVVIPLYNAAAYLEETVRSVMAQSVKAWELIIVDDRSTDGSWELAQKLAQKDSRIRTVRMDKNSGGPAAPRNRGVELALGEWIAFLDADDVWEPDKLARQLDFAKRYDLGFTSCDAAFIDAEGQPVQNIGFRLRQWWRRKKPKEGLAALMRDNFVITSSVLVKKSLLVPFDTRQEMVSVEDLRLWLQLFFDHPKAYRYQSEKLVRYRLLEGSISARKTPHLQPTRMLYCLSDFMLANDASSFFPVVRQSMARRHLFALLRGKDG